MTTSGLFMAALWNRAGHDIFALWFRLLSIFFFFSSPNLNGRRTQIGCLPYFYTINQNIIHRNNKLTYWLTTHGVVWPSANLECRSEMCCSRLAGNAALKNRQKFAIWAPSHNYVWLLSSQLRHVSTTTIGKNVLNSNVSPTRPYNKDMPGHAWRHSAVSCAKWLNWSTCGLGCELGWVDVGAKWRIRLIEPSVCGDAALWQITLTTCFAFDTIYRAFFLISHWIISVSIKRHFLVR